MCHPRSIDRSILYTPFHLWTNFRDKFIKDGFALPIIYYHITVQVNLRKAILVQRVNSFSSVLPLGLQNEGSRTGILKKKLTPYGPRLAVENDLHLVVFAEMFEIILETDISRDFRKHCFSL